MEVKRMSNKIRVPLLAVIILIAVLDLTGVIQVPGIIILVAAIFLIWYNVKIRQGPTNHNRK